MNTGLSPKVGKFSWLLGRGIAQVTSMVKSRMLRLSHHRRKLLRIRGRLHSGNALPSTFQDGPLSIPGTGGSDGRTLDVNKPGKRTWHSSRAIQIKSYNLLDDRRWISSGVRIRDVVVVEGSGRTNKCRQQKSYALNTRRHASIK